MKNKTSDSAAYAIGENLFILLPFLVMIIIYFKQDKLSSIFYEPEWSLASTVMIGQSIIKLIHTITKSASKNKNLSFRSYTIGAVLSFLVVIGLVPLIIILSLVFLSDKNEDWLMILQIIYFAVALTIFTAMNVGQIKTEEEDEEETKNQISALNSKIREYEKK